MVGKGSHTIPNGISLERIVIKWFEFKLAYNDVVVQCIFQFTMGTLPILLGIRKNSNPPGHSTVSQLESEDLLSVSLLGGKNN